MRGSVLFDLVATGTPPARLIGGASIAAGVILLFAQMELWNLSQEAIANSPSSPLEVGFYFGLESFYLAVVVGGVLYLRRALRTGPSDLSKITGVLSAAFRSRADVRIGAVAALAYLVFYAVVSSVIVYQPGVDFASAYGAAGPGVSTVACCGTLGSTPAVIVYLAPQLHLGLQVIPLDLLFLIVIPILVGANTALASYALRNRPRGTGGMWLGGVGAIVGLFTACPTCAGYFLAGTLGGLGGSSLAFALAPFQLAFILMSIPLLFVSLFATAFSVKRAFVASCRLPPNGPSAAPAGAPPR
jgi:hypothetical protein